MKPAPVLFLRCLFYVKRTFTFVIRLTSLFSLTFNFNLAIILNLGIILNLICTGAVYAFEEAYLPVTNQTLSHRFPQHVVSDSLESNEKIFVGKCTVEILSDRTLSVYGSDNEGKPWSFLAAATSAVSVVLSDLDSSGTDDLVLLMRTGATDWSPRSQIVILLFEKNGRPCPWSTCAYFELDDRGVKDLLDVNSDGRAELLFQSHADGFWRTEFLEARNCGLQRLEQLNGQSLPFFTRFTKVSNRSLSLGRTSRVHKSEVEKLCTIECVDWSRLPSQSRIKLDDGSPSLSVAELHGAIVLDEKQGRRISLLSKPGICRNLLQEIQHRGIPITVLERRGNDNHGLHLQLMVARASESPVSTPKRRTVRDLACLKAEEN